MEEREEGRKKGKKEGRMEGTIVSWSDKTRILLVMRYGLR